MRNSERTYVELLFRASRKYASWDPEMQVKVGDWGRITQGKRGLLFWRKNGTFLKEGNIYADGLAEKYGIPKPTATGASEENGERAERGESWIVSKNAVQVDVGGAVAGATPALAQCKLKGAYKFSSGRGALLVMSNPTISYIDPPGALRKLLQEPSMRDLVVVSEVHSCDSYARILTSSAGNTVALGLSVEPPVPGAAEAHAHATWVRSTSVGNFKSQVDETGERRYHPLFRLVSLTEKATSTGLRSSEEEWDGVPLPEAVPPWLLEQEEGKKLSEPGSK
ncbi:hypothetical protein FB45DRAFT_934596 [Roridomyces roridus]|uniref:Uncharacterized protein n=1 Tax=Roridomyces roridus TaxID=1738132 RepID=A0AAD7BCD0_9AGAR|nr:hypothetical protein FB45DRAFT_934596 [Roridomyces roridus]